MHGEKNFPFRKETSDLDVALADGTGDDDYLELLRSHLDEVLNRHQPDFVFYLAGADPFEGDRLGRLKLTIDGLRTRDEIVLDACRRRRPAGRRHDERRLRARHRRHRHHSRQHDSRRRNRCLIGV